MSRIGFLAVLGVLTILTGLTASEVLAQQKGDPAAAEPVYKARCLGCHGATGAGDGPTGQKLKDKPKDWTKGEGLKGLTDQQLFEVIKKGGPAIGRAKTMIAFPKLSDAEVWNLVAYVKTFSKG
ncbi:MAG: cytochrome c [Candidatus Rokubacteria bacterium]|nr:cytochrome c [Candidatus Rokubacteria bacterium]